MEKLKTIIIYLVFSMLFAIVFCKVEFISYSKSLESSSVDYFGSTPKEWYSGIWNGLFFVPNFVMSIFSETFFYKSNYTTKGYNIFFIIFSSISILTYFFILFPNYLPTPIRKVICKIQTTLKNILKIKS